MRQFFCALLCALCVLGGCGSQPVAWTTYSDARDGFSVMMPGTPLRESSTEGTGADSSTTTTHTVDLGGGHEYVVSVLTLPAAPDVVPAALYEEVLRETQNDSEMRDFEVISRNPTTQQGRPALDVEARSRVNSDPYFMRITLAGTRIYVVIATLPKAQRASGDAEKFLASFHVLP